MATNGETDARREPSAAEIRRRGDKLQVTLARIELALTNVLQDDAGGR
jgi:hypothetical protein